MSTVHCILDGNSHDVELEELIPAQDRASLGLPSGALSASSLTADQIRQGLASHFDKPLSDFSDLQVEFHKTGNITVRPDAVFG